MVNEMNREIGVLLVTGASRGIGAAVARLAGRRGWAVCVNYATQREAAEAVIKEIHVAGGRAIAVQADVANESEVSRLFETVDMRLGPLTGLVNNAALTTGRLPFLDMAVADLRRVLEVNIVGCFLCAQEAMRRMSTTARGSGGAIVNMTSQAGQFGGNRITAYAASKAAVVALTLGLAREAGPLGIRVNAVSPGIIDTGQEDLRDAVGRVTLEASIPLGRVGHPDEAAEAVLWLLSEAASYVNGSIISVSGGR